MGGQCGGRQRGRVRAQSRGLRACMQANAYWSGNALCLHPRGGACPFLYSSCNKQKGWPHGTSAWLCQLALPDARTRWLCWNGMLCQNAMPKCRARWLRKLLVRAQPYIAMFKRRRQEVLQSRTTSVQLESAQHVYTHTQTHMRTHTCTHTRAHTHTREHSHAHAHIHTHLHTYTRAHTRTPTHFQVHSHTCTRTHTHTHAPRTRTHRQTEKLHHTHVCTHGFHAWTSKCRQRQGRFPLGKCV